MSDICYVDVETTGLDPDLHVLWEYALVCPNRALSVTAQVRLTYSERVAADPKALEVGRWHDRYDPGTAQDVAVAADQVRTLTEGVTLVGAQTHFDAGFLTRLLGRAGLTPGWHHRLMCVESMGAAVLGWPIARSLSDTASALGIDPSGFDRHTALGDALLARAVYGTVLAVGEGVTA